MLSFSASSEDVCAEFFGIVVVYLLIQCGANTQPRVLTESVDTERLFRTQFVRGKCVKVAVVDHAV